MQAAQFGEGFAGWPVAVLGTSQVVREAPRRSDEMLVKLRLQAAQAQPSHSGNQQRIDAAQLAMRRSFYATHRGIERLEQLVRQQC